MDNYLRFEEIEKTMKQIEESLAAARAKLEKLMPDIEKEAKPKKKQTIVFDFDGVIHTHYDGWRDGSIYGIIDCDVLTYMKKLMEDYYVVISSNRPAEQIVSYLNMLPYVDMIGLKFDIFDQNEEAPYWLVDDVIGVTNHKAVGALYIDDRGYRYKGLEDLKEYIEVIGIE